MKRQPGSALIDALELLPHPEGGFYREVFRSINRVSRDGDRRSALTSIYFLLQAGQVSRWHVVASDEAWHFYEGAPLELLTFAPERKILKIVKLGPESADSQRVHVVPAGHWQAARPLGDFSLAGCSVGPGFDFADFRFVVDTQRYRAVFDGVLADYVSLL